MKQNLLCFLTGFNLYKKTIHLVSTFILLNLCSVLYNTIVGFFIVFYFYIHRYLSTNILYFMTHYQLLVYKSVYFLTLGITPLIHPHVSI